MSERKATDMGMVERVAREICKNAGHVTDRHWQHYTNAARAAIEAMREPTERMIAAGAQRASGFASTGNRMCNGYRAMIDKAIQESGE